MFNKETEYAIRALVYIQVQNYNGLMPGAREISSEIDAPQFYISKILHQLVRKGLLSSVRGKGGGFFFAENKAELPLIDLIYAIEGGKKIEGCGFGLKDCNDENPCPFHEQYSPIREAVKKLVSTVSIQSLAARMAENNREKTQ